MQEIEVKILEVNRERIEKQLMAFGAQKLFGADIITLLLDTQNSQIRNRKDVLRLRKQNGNVELTYKKVRVNESVKVAEEYTVQVSDLEAALKILQAIGFSPTEKMEKHRISYAVGNVRFDIDKYSGEFGFIPEFLEIEGAPNDIKKYAEALGYQEKDCLPWSTDELINHYASKKGRS
ncbi:MAG: class IV adenylate cyclase [Candidatus Bathyarchaeota archaeon]|nr:class IV adenylate cyclase [Candidatus Bathyarchaeota archaeon]